MFRRLLSFAAAAFLVCMLSTVSLAKTYDSPLLTPEQGAEFIKESPNLFLLDVRTPDEFAAAHLEGAVNIPLYELAKRLGDVPQDRPVLVHCAAGKRAAQGYKMLKNAYPAMNLSMIDGAPIFPAK